MENSNEYSKIVLAALLHDIGKFYQRAGYLLDEGSSRDSYDLMTFSVKKHDRTKPRYSHVHGAYTARFFREYLPGYDAAGVIAALHHIPENAKDERERLLARMIALADWMSSGERLKRDESEEDGIPSEEAMISIFSQLEVDKTGKNNKGQDDNNRQDYIPLRALDDRLENIFPVKNKKEAFSGAEGKTVYKNLWQNFVSELGKLKEENLFQQIYYLLQKYTLTMPSATYQEKPDISLFHHSKSTTAIVACLYQLSQDKSREIPLDEIYLNNIFRELRLSADKSQPDQFSYLNRPDFLLVGGDISGIQEFIYQVTSDKALKGLRARSFYLQLLSELVARKIIREFELTEANLLYCGGGNFYILVPKLGQAEDKIEEIQRELDGILLRAHKGKIAAIIGYEPVSYHDFVRDFASIWQKLTGEIVFRKKRKFSSLLSMADPISYKQKIFGPFDLGGERQACQVCGEELGSAGKSMCELCDSFVRMTQELNQADFLVIEPIEKKETPEKIQDWYEIGESLGFRCQFLKDVKPEKKYIKNALVINSVDFAARADGFISIAQLVSQGGERTITLENMAEAAEGIEKWGALRADVDRLGEVFRDGLGDNKTISRVSMLSSLLSLYFSARISRIKDWILKYSDHPGLTDRLYIVYSGGDDLFILGPWSVLPELAKSIRDDFSRFTCKRLTISAGLYFAPGKKFPVYQAAHMAGEAEDQAKNDGRSKLNIFGESVDWDCLPGVFEIIKLIADLLQGRNGSGVPRSLLNVLYNIYQDRKLKNEGKIPMQRIWRMHYALRKLTGRLDERSKNDLEKLLRLILTNYEIYPHLNIATRVADYLTRK